MDKLDRYRKQIDKIDLQIIGLLRKRFDIVKNKIFPYKKLHNIDYIQNKRYKELLENLLNQSDSLITKNFIKTFCLIIHKHSIKLQK